MEKGSRTNPLYGILTERYLLNKKGATKETFHIVIKIEESLDYRVGDSLAILPSNPLFLVEKILTLLPQTKTIIHKKTKELVNLKNHIRYHTNLNKITPGFLRLLVKKDLPSKDFDHLQTLLDPANKEQLHTYLLQRELIDLLEEYPHVLSAQEVTDLLLPMLPRYYSTASSQKKDPHHIHLTVAHVNYESLGKARIGIGSHYLCKEAKIQETRIPLFVHPAINFSLPQDSQKDIIMIGPGTGIAPFRGFLEERVVEKASGKNWLFFGERNSTDFYYEDFFKELEKNDLLKLSTAFSRDQEEKVYVQHKMYEHAKELFSWLENGAHFYVCGDAKKMAKDVQKTLLDIIQKEGKLSLDNALTYFDNLKKQKRYLTDIY